MTTSSLFRIRAAGLSLSLTAVACQLGTPSVGAPKLDMTEPPPPPVPDLWQPPPPDLARQPTSDFAQPPPPPPDLARPPEPAIPGGFIDTNLEARRVDYGLALRAASLKLLGELPDSDEQAALANDKNPEALYQKRITAYLASPKFARQMVLYFRNVFRAGGAGGPGLPASLDTAANYAAQLVVTDQDFTKVVTASSSTCPTFNAANGQFAPASCNNVPMGASSGVLTDPGVMGLNHGALAFRRARWVQQTFACSDYPTEFRNNPRPVGGGVLTSPWEVNQISAPFRDTTTVLCVNCHGNMNHLSPVFANFDTLGVLKNAIQVTLPGGQIVAVPTDWLPQGEAFAWRFDMPTPNVAALGQALARDPVFANCVATRIWDWAMSKNDAIAEPAVPEDVVAPVRSAMVNNGNKVKAAIFAAFTSQDYLKF